MPTSPRWPAASGVLEKVREPGLLLGEGGWGQRVGERASGGKDGEGGCRDRSGWCEGRWSWGFLPTPWAPMQAAAVSGAGGQRAGVPQGYHREGDRRVGLGRSRGEGPQLLLLGHWALTMTSLGNGHSLVSLRCCATQRLTPAPVTLGECAPVFFLGDDPLAPSWSRLGKQGPEKERDLPAATQPCTGRTRTFDAPSAPQPCPSPALPALRRLSPALTARKGKTHRLGARDGLRTAPGPPRREDRPPMSRHSF